MKFLILFVIFQIFKTSNSFTIECVYRKAELIAIYNVYQCESTNIPTSSGIAVTNVTGTHLNGQTNNEVDSIKIDGKNSLSFVPRNISKHFPNIRAIHLYYMAIETLFGDEFNEFPKLEYLAVTVSPLTTISSKLFEKTPKIVFVSFNGCHLKRIGYDLFTPLNVTQLKEINFAYANCISRSAYSNTMLSLINDLREKCPYDDEFPATTEKSCIFENVEDFVCELKSLVIEIQEDLTTNNEKINEIELELSQSKEEVKKLSEELQVKDEQIESLKSELESLKNEIQSRMQLLEEEYLKIKSNFYGRR